MATMRKYFNCAVAVVLAAFFGFLWGRGSVPPPTTIERTVRDTITLREVVADTIVQTRVVYRDLPSVEYVRDTLLLRDTLRVAIPLSLYTFTADDYRAEVEGYAVSLRKIEVYPKTTYQTRIEKTNPRWGVGVQLGIGVSGQGFSPYLGVGVQYNFLSW